MSCMNHSRQAWICGGFVSFLRIKVTTELNINVPCKVEEQAVGICLFVVMTSADCSHNCITQVWMKKKASKMWLNRPITCQSSDVDQLFHCMGLESIVHYSSHGGLPIFWVCMCVHDSPQLYHLMTAVRADCSCKSKVNIQSECLVRARVCWWTNSSNREFSAYSFYQLSLLLQ